MNKLFDLGNLPCDHLTQANYHLHSQNQATDQNRRFKYGKVELDQLITKTMVSSSNYKYSFCTKIKLLMRFQTQNGSLVRVKNRCILSTRAATIKPFRISRIHFRTQSHYGQLPGVSKRTNR